CETRNWGSLGGVRIDLHRHRGGTHAVCSARSRGMELATNRFAWNFSRTRDRLAILPDHFGAAGARLSCVPGSRTVLRWNCYLGRCMRYRGAAYLLFLWLSAHHSLSGRDACAVLRIQCIGLQYVDNVQGCVW